MEEELQNEETESAKSPIQHAAKFGAILGVIGAIITLLLYVINPALLINIWMLALLLVYIALVVYGGITYRKEIGGYIDFGPAYLHGFITFVVMGLISLLINFLLYNIVDSSLPEVLTDASMEQTASMMERFGAPESAIEDALEQQRPEIEAGFTNFGLIKGFFTSLIFYAVICLITGLIVRRREKVSDVY